MLDHNLDKYISTQAFAGRLNQADLASKNDIGDFIKKE